MTYAQILDSLIKLTGRPALTQSVPVLVALMEADLNRRLATAGVTSGQGRATATVAAGAEYLDAPDDMARIVQVVRKPDGAVIEGLTQAGFEAVRDGGAAGGSPACFVLAGGALRLYPIPAADQQIELVYQRSVAGLSDANQSNWVSAASPDVYIYGLLWKAAEATGELEAGVRWLALYDRAVEGLIEAERERPGARKAGAYRPDLPCSPGLTPACEV